MRQWKKVFLDLGLEFILCREDSHYYGFSIFHIIKHSDGRQNASSFCASIVTADRVLDATGRRTTTAVRVLDAMGWNTLTADRIPDATG